MLNHSARKKQVSCKSNVVQFPAPLKLTVRQEAAVKLFSDTLGLPVDHIENELSSIGNNNGTYGIHKDNVVLFPEPAIGRGVEQKNLRRLRIELEIKALVKDISEITGISEGDACIMKLLNKVGIA